MSFVISYPYTTPTLVVTLPSPQFGDTQSVDVGLTQHLMQNGTYRTYRKEAYEVLEYRFLIQECGNTLRQDLETLLLTVRGADLKIETQGTTYRARLTTETLTLTTEGRNTYSVTLSFRGVQV